MFDEYLTGAECVQGMRWWPQQETPLLFAKRRECVPGRGNGMCKGPVAGAQGARQAGEVATPGPQGNSQDMVRNHVLFLSLQEQ